MAQGIATRSSRGHRTICLPIKEEDYLRIVNDPKTFRRTIDDRFRQTPELFPANFVLGYELKDGRISVKQEIMIRRIVLKDGSAYSIRPSFLMPYMTAQHSGGRRTTVPAQVRRPLLGLGPRLRRRSDVPVSPGVRVGPVQCRGNHRPLRSVA